MGKIRCAKFNKLKHVREKSLAYYFREQLPDSPKLEDYKDALRINVDVPNIPATILREMPIEIVIEMIDNSGNMLWCGPIEFGYLINYLIYGFDDIVRWNSVDNKEGNLEKSYYLHFLIKKKGE